MFSSGVVLITGEHGTGKTSMALEVGDPSRTMFVDNDLKGRSTVKQVREDGVEFGRYVDLITLTRGKRALESHMIGLSLIDEIGDDEFDVISWDTWTEFSSTCHAYVKQYPDKFRDPDRWAAMGKIRSGEEYKEARFYEAELISRLQQKAPVVVLVSHLKNQYLNNAPTGKEIPAVSKAVDRVCNLRLWLRHNPDPAIHTPIGLVLKNIDKKVYDPELRRLRTVQILPTKISPLPGERSLWDSIERYYNDPAGLREPTPDEIPDDFESSIVQGTLTEDQRLSWLTAIKQERDREAEEMLLEMEENRVRAHELQESGMGFPQIAKELEIPIPNVIRLLKEE
jgi:hypothetical protein